MALAFKQDFDFKVIKVQNAFLSSLFNLQVCLSMTKAFRGTG